MLELLAAVYQTVLIVLVPFAVASFALNLVSLSDLKSRPPKGSNAEQRRAWTKGSFAYFGALAPFLVLSVASPFLTGTGQVTPLVVTGVTGFSVGALGLVSHQAERWSAEPSSTVDLLEDLRRCWRREDPVTRRTLVRYKAALRRLNVRDSGRAFYFGRNASLATTFEATVRSVLEDQFDVKGRKFQTLPTWALGFRDTA